MSPRALRRVLWLLLVVALPLPLWGIEWSVVPPAGALMLAGLCAAVIVVESARGVVGILLGAFALQAALQMAILWGVSWAIAAATRRTTPRRRAVLALAFTAILLLVVSIWPIYRTPYSASSLHARWPEVFE